MYLNLIRIICFTALIITVFFYYNISSVIKYTKSKKYVLTELSRNGRSNDVEIIYKNKRYIIGDNLDNYYNLKVNDSISLYYNKQFNFFTSQIL